MEVPDRSVTALLIVPLDREVDVRRLQRFERWITGVRRTPAYPALTNRQATLDVVVIRSRYRLAVLGPDQDVVYDLDVEVQIWQDIVIFASE